MGSARSTRKTGSLVREREDPTDLPPSVLGKLDLDDLPDGIAVQVGTMKDGILHLDWEGTLGRDL
jgi:hypothetical protein